MAVISDRGSSAGKGVMHAINYVQFSHRDGKNLEN